MVKKQITIVMDEDLLKKIDKEAKLLERSRSWLIEKKCGDAINEE